MPAPSSTAALGTNRRQNSGMNGDADRRGRDSISSTGATEASAVGGRTTPHVVDRRHRASADARAHTGSMAPLPHRLDDSEALVLRHRRLARHLAQRYVRGGESTRGPRAGRLCRPRQGRPSFRSGPRCRVHDLRRADDPRRAAPLLPRHALGRARPALDPGARAGAAPDRGCPSHRARARTEHREAAALLGWSEEEVHRSPPRRGRPEPTVAQRHDRIGRRRRR